ncbi:MAG: hypothetical protein NUV84_00120, partial [Candidatus Uhrbacteria bacterium]|nr:hypothetical protein [Candidatus Uhrbacteria bacterium]
LALIERFKLFETKKDALELQRAHLLADMGEFGKRNGIEFQQDPAAVEIRYFDRVLTIGKKGKRTPYFDHNENVLRMDVNVGPNILAHELAHATSFDQKTKTGGFLRFTSEGTEGNQSLTEGATMMVEFELVPTKREDTRDVGDDLYDGYYWFTDLIRTELEVERCDFLRAYYGQEPYPSKFEEKVRSRFGCTVDELSHLFLGYSDKAKELMRKIVKGDAVKLSASNQGGLLDEYRRLSRIFPNIEVIEKTPRSAQENDID